MGARFLGVDRKGRTRPRCLQEDGQGRAVLSRVPAVLWRPCARVPLDALCCRRSKLVWTRVVVLRRRGEVKIETRCFFFRSFPPPPRSTEPLPDLCLAIDYPYPATSWKGCAEHDPAILLSDVPLACCRGSVALVFISDVFGVMKGA